MSDEPKYDVVIYHLESRKVESVIGKDMYMDRGHYNAQKRLQTAFMRINENYSAAIVDAGKLDVGSVINDSDAR